MSNDLDYLNFQPRIIAEFEVMIEMYKLNSIQGIRYTGGGVV